VIDSTPRRRHRAKARASTDGAIARQVQLPIDERSKAERLHAAIRGAYDEYDRVVAQRRRVAR